MISYPLQYLYISGLFFNHKSVPITIFLPVPVMKKGDTFMFPCYLAFTTDEVEHSRYITFHGDFLGVLHSIVLVFWPMWRSPMRE